MKLKLIIYSIILFITNSLNSQIMNKVGDVVMSDILINTNQFSEFGRSSAVSGNYAVVGAVGYLYGSFYILEKNQNGEWINKQLFSPHLENGINNYSSIGRSVDIDSNYIIIGDESDSPINSNGNIVYSGGAAFIYKRDVNGQWNFLQKIIPNNIEHFDGFGSKVSISGDYAFISACYDDDDEQEQNELNDSGAIYVFKRDPNDNWVQIQKIVEFDRATLDQFGFSLDSYKNQLIVGSIANSLDENGQNNIENVGAAYIYSYNIDSNRYIFEDKIVYPESNLVPYISGFGYDVAIYDNQVAISKRDTVIMFEKINTNNWTLQEIITRTDLPSNLAIDAGGGFRVALSENRLAIGAECIGQGQVEIYEKDQLNSWKLVQKIINTAPNTYTDDFGQSVDFSENTLIIGDKRTIDGNNYTICQVGSVVFYDYCKSFSTINIEECSSYISPSGLYEWTQSGTYYDTILNVKGCDSIIEIHLIINNSLYPVNTSISISSDFILQADEPGLQYAWLDCNNNYEIISDETNQTYIVTLNGSYAVQISNNGCIDTSNCITVSSLGISDLKTADIILLPNPTNDFVTITLNQKYKDIHSIVFDAQGRIISQKKYEEASNLNLLNDQNPGLYTIQLITDSFSKTFNVLKN